MGEKHDVVRLKFGGKCETSILKQPFIEKQAVNAAAVHQSHE